MEVMEKYFFSRASVNTLRNKVKLVKRFHVFFMKGVIYFYVTMEAQAEKQH